MVSEEADQRGRYADSPWAIPLRGWIEVLKRTWSEATEDSIGLVAAGVAFYGFLAIAPLLAATKLVYGLIAEPADVGSDLRAMLTVMPPDAVRLIDDLLVAAVHTSEGKAGFRPARRAGDRVVRRHEWRECAHHGSEYRL